MVHTSNQPQKTRNSKSKQRSGKSARTTHKGSNNRTSSRSRNSANQQKRTVDSLRDKTVKLQVTAISHEGRGIAEFTSASLMADDAKSTSVFTEKYGKKVFIENALPGETVLAKITHEKKSFAEAVHVKLVDNIRSKERSNPDCEHYADCGGCQMQHIQHETQIATKLNAFTQQLLRSYNYENIPFQAKWLPTLESKALHYRRKVRFGIRFVRGSLIVGFREAQTNYLVDIHDCKVLHPAIDSRLELIKSVLVLLSNIHSITHLEVVVGEHSAHDTNSADAPVTMLIRHEQGFSNKDTQLLCSSFPNSWQLLSQPKKGAKPLRISMDKVVQDSKYETLNQYFIPKSDVVLSFSVQDFVQVNADINRTMIANALTLLELQEGEKVADLFCGLGNFSLPLARQVGSNGFVYGIEGSSVMAQRAHNNALDNGLTNCRFLAQDLTADALAPLLKEKLNIKTVDAVLIDPPRSGAKEMLETLVGWQPKRMVYISCNMATFVRDAIILEKLGFVLTHVGMMDMFPHTKHMEVIARFQPR